MAEMQGTEGSNKGYGKRPLWQWILLYVVIGGLIYLAIYFFIIGSHNNANPYSVSSHQSQTKSNAPAASNAILVTKSDPTLGKYLANSSGQPLYIHKSDSNGMSNCTGSCLTTWPAYQDKGSTKNLPVDVGTIKRSDNGETQFTYNGMPLYTFTGDSNGKVTGNGVSDFTIAKPVAVTNPSTPSQPTNTTTPSGSNGY